MIDFGKEEEVETKKLVEEILEFVDDVVDDLGSRTDVEAVKNILENGTGADRQLKVFNETKDLKKVVEFIIENTKKGIE